MFYNIGLNHFGYNRIRILLAVLLLTASGLKGHQLATSPVLGDGFLDSRWLLIATVEFELFFGLWLLSGLLPRLTWLASVGCFGLFAAISLYKAVSGEASCGCFGPVEVNPWYTFALDVSAVFALLRWRPLGQKPVFAAHFEEISLRAMAVVVIWLLIGVPAAFAMGSYAETTISDTGDIIGNGKIVVLKPEKWVGKCFPLLPFIEDIPGCMQIDQSPLREQLAEGKWIVILYHHECQKCQEVINKHKHLPQRSVLNPAAPRVVLIELPPYDKNDDWLPPLNSSSYVFGRLSGEKE